MSIVTTANGCEFNGLLVKGLIAIASCNASHKSFLTTITKVVAEQQQESILSATSEQLLARFSTSTEETAVSVDADNTATFKIKNAHGLHARPGAMLVAEAKKNTNQKSPY